ncbi:MAG: transcriptional repressor LexA [Pyrinomonadaceae bacterium]
MLPSTERQRDILEYITSFTRRHGYVPSYAQIARHLGLSSKATVARHIEALEKRGLLERKRENGAFELDICIDETSDQLCEVTLLGRVAAGEPIEAIETAETIVVPRYLLGRVRPEKVYALRVQGDSMIDEHICDGDIALIENRIEAQNGEIVVALIDNERATLKRFYRRGMEVELRAANSSLAPLFLPAEQVTVQGVFRGLLRTA